MAGEDEKGKAKARGAAEGPPKARSARRADGAVHGPGAGALRLRVEQAAPVSAGESGGGRHAAGGPGRPAGDQRRAARRRRAGPGADRGDAPHSRACASARCATSGRSTTRSASSTPSSGSSRRSNGYEDYREMLDKEKELDAVDHRHARLLARAAHDRLPEGRQARLLREGDVEHARGRAQHGARRARDRQAPPDRPPAPLEPALHPLLREAADRGQAARPHRHRQRAVEPRACRPTSGRPTAT